MKLLKKLLLINWHYFSHQLLEFEQLNCIFRRVSTTCTEF